MGQGGGLGSLPPLSPPPSLRGAKPAWNQGTSPRGVVEGSTEAQSALTSSPEPGPGQETGSDEALDWPGHGFSQRTGAAIYSGFQAGTGLPNSGSRTTGRARGLS